MNKRLIVALDFDNAKSTLDFLENIDPDKCMVKVGLELFISEGWKILDLISEKGFEIFLDNLKLPKKPLKDQKKNIQYPTLKNLKEILHLLLIKK